MSDKEAAAAVFRVWQAWTPEEAEPASEFMRDVGMALIERGYITRYTYEPTAEGRSLLASSEPELALRDLLTSAVRDLEKGLTPGREWLAAAKKLLGEEA